MKNLKDTIILLDLFLSGNNNESSFYMLTKSSIEHANHWKRPKNFFEIRYQPIFESINSVKTIIEVNVSDCFKESIGEVCAMFDLLDWLGIEDYYFEHSYDEQELLKLVTFDFLLVEHTLGYDFCLGIVENYEEPIKIYGIKKSSKVWRFLFRNKDVIYSDNKWR